MRDQYGNIIRTDFDKVALARTVSSSLSSSTEIVFNANTKVIRVCAISKDVYLKWGIDDCAVDRFDEVILAGTYLDLPIALQTDGTPFTACNLLERTASAICVTIEK